MAEPTFIEMPDGSLAVDGNEDFPEFDQAALDECCCAPTGRSCTQWWRARWDSETQTWTIWQGSAPGCVTGCVQTDWAMIDSDPNNWERTLCWASDCIDGGDCFDSPDPGEPPPHG